MAMLRHAWRLSFMHKLASLHAFMLQSKQAFTDFEYVNLFNTLLTVLWLNVAEIIIKVMTTRPRPFRPRISKSKCTDGWMELIKLCWDENPRIRPSFDSIIQRITVIDGGRWVQKQYIEHFLSFRLLILLFIFYSFSSIL